MNATARLEGVLLKMKRNEKEKEKAIHFCSNSGFDPRVNCHPCDPGSCVVGGEKPLVQSRSQGKGQPKCSSEDYDDKDNKVLENLA